MDLDLVKKATAYYSEGASASDAARLKFFEGLYQLIQERAEQLEGTQAVDTLSSEKADACYTEGTPLLWKAPVVVKPEDFAKTCSEVAAYLVENAGLEDAAAKALAAYDWDWFVDNVQLTDAGRDPSEFVESCLKRTPKLGVGSDMPVTVFGLVAGFALRAHLQQHAADLMTCVSKDILEGLNHDAPVACPVCGSAAAASVVWPQGSASGHGRSQYCAKCGTMWHFERIRCGHCGTQSTSHLHYYHIEGDSAHRIHTCDDCGGYERVVFQEEIKAPFCMEVEDVVMARLDQVALDPSFQQR